MKTTYIIILSLLILLIAIYFRYVQLKKLYDNLSYSFKFQGVNASNIFSEKDLDLSILLSVLNPTNSSIVLRKFKLRMYYDSKLIGETINNKFTENFSILKNKTTNSILDFKFYINSGTVNAIKDVILNNKTIDVDYVVNVNVLGIIPITYRDKYPINKSDFA